MAKTFTRTTPERFIQVVMRSQTIAAAASELGCSAQAVSKRLKEYREAGVKGLPDFTSKSLDVKGIQALVNKHSGGK